MEKFLMQHVSTKDGVIALLAVAYVAMSTIAFYAVSIVNEVVGQ